VLARTATAAGDPPALVSFLDISGNLALATEARGATVVALVKAALMAPRGHGYRCCSYLSLDVEGSN
jgi:hypothetical protein